MAATAVYCRIVPIPLDNRMGGDSFSCSNVSVDQTFRLSTGGMFSINVKASTYGTVALQQLGADDTTYTTVTIFTGTATVTAGTVPGAAASFAADGNGYVYLSPGTYRLHLA
jgi:hypothetical protein